MADLFTEVYNWLPLCHLINKKVLVMHGGLFKRDDVKLEELRTIDRNRQPGEEGLIDQMGNKGAFITMGSDVKPNFTSYDAVPHPDVEPMAYANSFMSMFGFM
ncbi:Serine/threonine-protein phosphatase 5 [Acropora cervicornis]|uniref:Serine/threonine-protein phosphatase 5 n=1 Tax=Acropora cervicornis TaxID=6130 RepID=A0AAD9Q427_ACRCE|nr:Serine/threonine-protein phosphatase 5 [Acropora cervicornis]